MGFLGDLDRAESLLWGTWGIFSFIILIVYLRWMGPPVDQGEVSEKPKGRTENG
jgi:hypothetical protein